MSNNIVIGQNIVHAKQTINIGSTGITSGNTLIIYQIEPDFSRSFVPERTINQFTQFVEGKSYLLIALQVMDLTEFVYPPYPSDNNTIITEDGNDIIPE